jgi:PAS domain S-box-containing protein
MAKAEILIVEDDGIVAKDIQNRLKSLGFGASTMVPSGEEAIIEVGEKAPDLVLMDIMLKGEMNGTEAAEQIRSQFNIPVVYLTAYTDEEVLNKAKVTEPFGYIIKPFEDRELNAAIEIALYKHRMEKRLKESEQWLSTTLMSIGDAVIATEKNGHVVFMNYVAELLTGWKQKEAMGRPLEDVFNIINEETRKEVENPVNKVIREGKIVGLANHTMLIAKDGTELAIDDSGSPIIDERGDIIGIVLVFRDVGEKRQAENALRESEERYSALFDRSLDCVFVNNLDGDFIDANSAALNLLGYKKEDIRSLNYALLLSEEQLSKSVKVLEEIVETGSQKELLELKLRRKDGKSVHVETKGSLIYRDGKPYAVQGIARDITDRREAERDRELLLAELEAKNKELESFVYSITHDLKTPLVSLQGFSSLLQRQLHDQLDEEGKHYMERIQDNVAHMDSLISDLLELSRIGRVVGPMEEIDVAALLKEIQQDFAVELEEAGAELVVQEPLPVVHADPGRIRQVFTNLIDNAFKFRSQDRPLRIEVGCKEERGSYRIHVADNGIGIAPQYQEQTFVPFRKLDPKTEGMGIGLALVQKIVESHGGRVWVESETAEGQEGGGSTFYLTLPRREES